MWPGTRAEGSRSREDGKNGDGWWMMMIDDGKWTWQMNLMTMMWWEYTTDWCFYGGFTQTNFYTGNFYAQKKYREKSLHRGISTQKLLHRKTCTRKTFIHRQDAHTHRNFWKHLHKKHFLQVNFYIQKLLHRKKNAQNNFYTQMDETWLPLPPWEKFGKIQVDHLEINSCEIKFCVRTPV